MQTLPTLGSFYRLNLRLSNKAYNTNRLSIKMDSNTMVMSIKMVKKKDLEYKHILVARN